MAHSGTRVLYTVGSKTISLENVITRNWEFHSEYDDDGTLMGHKFKAEFESLIIKLETAADNNDIGVNENAPVGHTPFIYNNIKRHFSTPRGRLRVAFDGETAIDITPNTGVPSTNSPSQPLRPPTQHVNTQFGEEYDVENGPRPTKIDITHVTGKSVLRIVWAVEAFLGPCASHVPPILASRWTVTETMDEDFFITRKFQGYLRKSNWNTSSAGYRRWMFPGLEDGFRRTNVDYDEHADHLGIDWRVIDKQVHVAAPWPLTRLEGQQTETTGNGIQWFTEVRLRANGSPEATKRDMMQQLSRIMQMRIAYQPDTANTKWKLEGVTIVDHFGEKNQIEFICRVQHRYGSEPNATTEFYAGMRTRIFDPQVNDISGVGHDPAGQPHPYVSTVSRIPEPWGYATQGNRQGRLPIQSGKWEHLLRDICKFEADKPLWPSEYGTDYGTPFQTSREPGETPITYVPALAEDDITNYDDESAVAHYTIAKAMDEYSYQHRRIALPIMFSYRGQAGASSAIVDFGDPLITREITMEFERVGKWPAIPTPQEHYIDPHNGSMFRLLSHRVQSRAPTPGADGKQLIYHIWAMYVYVLQGRGKNIPGPGWGLDDESKGWSLAGLPGMSYRKHLNVKKLYRDVKGHKINAKRKKAQKDPEDDDDDV